MFQYGCSLLLIISNEADYSNTMNMLWKTPEQLPKYLSFESSWLVGCFWAYRPFETVFQSISGRLPREKEKRKDR